jgi:hypothetical protein
VFVNDIEDGLLVDFYRVERVMVAGEKPGAAASRGGEGADQNGEESERGFQAGRGVFRQNDTISQNFFGG